MAKVKKGNALAGIQPLHIGLIVGAAAAVVGWQSLLAGEDCSFAMNGNVMVLEADCTTDETIMIPDGFTLDGKNHTITAVDPAGDHFKGAVVANEGAVAHVSRLKIATSGLSNVCDAGDDRLRGIMFEGAAGSITHNSVAGLNQGPSGCQEGNAIEVRNEPFDGTHPATKAVTIANNNVDKYQKTGIVANGDVDVTVEHNQVGASATQQNLAANSIQLGFGALGQVRHNNVDGNQWLGASDFAATALLIFAAGADVDVSQNQLNGNADVGLYVFADGGTYDNNKVFEAGEDGPHGDFGIVNFGDDNAYTNNKIRGFDDPTFGVTEGRNKVIPGPPQAAEAWGG